MRILLGFVLLCYAARATGALGVVQPRAVPAIQRAAQGADFRLENNTRCNGHYRVAGWDQDSVNSCQQLCQQDEKCAKFSLQIVKGRGCFLFDSEASCVIEQTWTTGHKDTRCAVTKDASVAALKCPYGTTISQVVFASYGTPTGTCGSFAQGVCHQANTKELVEDLCVGENECRISASAHLFGEPCPVVEKNFRVQVECAVSKSFNEDIYFNAWSSRHWAEADQEASDRRQELQAFLKVMPSYPPSRFSGRGIIVVAGGRYLEPAVVMIQLLRASGCELRIQVWHLGKEEMSAAHRQLLAPYGVETRDFHDYVDDEALQPIAANVGMRLFQLKPLALLHSDLEDILLLDSDNCPIKDPSFLFDSPVYTKVGTVFWPDYWKTSVDNPIWKIIGVEPTNSWEQESGQLMINKQHAWTALNLCVHINTEFYMRLLNGDKDTFRFAWLAADVPFYMVEHWPEAIGTLKERHSQEQGFCSHTMLQHDFAGVPLFVHHNQLKTSSHLAVGENFKYKKLLSNTNEPIKAVPVAGLQFNNGFLLPCIDIHGQGMLKVDDEACPVIEANLLDFEMRYFEALASIPEDAFTAEKQRNPTLLSKDDVAQQRASAHFLVMDKEKLIQRLRHADQNTTCTTNEFELEAPTLLTDRQCEPVTVCSAEQTEISPPTGTTDRECTGPAPAVAVRTFNVRARSTKTAQHPYFNLGAAAGFEIQDLSIPEADFVEGKEITVTRLESYEFHMVDVPTQHPFILTLDNVGGSDSVPYTNGVLGSGATGNQHLTFTPSPSTASMLYYQSHMDTHMGWRVLVRDPRFDNMYSGNHAGHAGSHQRFSTAYSTQARLFEHSAQPAEGVFSDIRLECQEHCAVVTSCQGVFVFRTAQRVVCYGLGSTFGEPAATSSDSQSWTKVV